VSRGGGPSRGCAQAARARRHTHTYSPLCTPPPSPPPPADFGLIRERCAARHYRSLQHWLGDATLVLDNCRAYNKAGTDYAACAGKVDMWVTSRLRTWTVATAGAAAAAAAPTTLRL
jgi:hypothetical protein